MGILDPGDSAGENLAAQNFNEIMAVCRVSLAFKYSAPLSFQRQQMEEGKKKNLSYLAAWRWRECWTKNMWKSYERKEVWEVGIAD